MEIISHVNGERNLNDTNNFKNNKFNRNNYYPSRPNFNGKHFIGLIKT